MHRTEEEIFKTKNSFKKIYQKIKKKKSNISLDDILTKNSEKSEDQEKYERKRGYKYKKQKN